MTIYLQSTPSLRNKRTRKSSRKLLEEENKRRRELGLPLASLKYEKLDRERVRSSSNAPKHRTPRSDETKSIPSRNGNFGPNATARRSMMEKVATGEITGDAAEEIIRKSKCLAPAYNKGAVQYIGSEDAAKDAGKKK